MSIPLWKCPWKETLQPLRLRSSRDQSSTAPNPEKAPGHLHQALGWVGREVAWHPHLRSIYSESSSLLDPFVTAGLPYPWVLGLQKALKKERNSRHLSV